MNTASRMESPGLPGPIQVAASNWAILRGRHAFAPLNLSVKGLGSMTSYLYEDQIGAGSDLRTGGDHADWPA